MQKGLIFYRSFYDLISMMKKSKRWRMMEMICEYAFNGIAPDFQDDDEITVFNVMRPQIDANSLKYERRVLQGLPKTKP